VLLVAEHEDDLTKIFIRLRLLRLQWILVEKRKEIFFHFPNACNFILRMWKPSVSFVRTVVYPSRSDSNDDSLEYFLIILADFDLEFWPNFIPPFESLVFADTY